MTKYWNEGLEFVSNKITSDVKINVYLKDPKILGICIKNTTHLSINSESNNTSSILFGGSKYEYYYVDLPNASGVIPF